MKAKNLRNLEDRIEEIILELTDLKLQVVELSFDGGKNDHNIWF